ncbi:MAG TPA: non-canonical purine NTP pyrophosphatase [Bdellovibrionota bacterium]|jgi:inosine/xanthosine triphosphate pyrophosphatase family protein|nr:non-canonical purine NTP pyrophosphatase [Bdellovibrionota bacterium]
MWKVNTSNASKLAEFRKYLGEVEATPHDLEEPDADLYTVIQYKASQFEGVIVDDTSLEIDGVAAGVNIRWLLETLDQHIGKRAEFTCLLGICRGDQVSIFEGRTRGHIVAPCGDSFGFNNSFLPEGAERTFGEEIPDALNPRKLAIDALLAERPAKVLPSLKTWDGKFQSS